MILAGHQVLWRKRPEKLPSLSGILRGKAKTNARTPIGTEEGYPLLSFGRIGLGKVAIWTSDLSGKWSSGWIRWTPSGPELFAQIVRHLSDAGGDLDFAGRVTLLRGPIGDSIQVSPGTTSERISLLQLEPSRKNISLHVAQNGTLRGLLERERVPGNYRLIKTEGENSESLLFTTMPPYEAEFELPPPQNLHPAGKTQSTRPGKEAEEFAPRLVPSGSRLDAAPGNHPPEMEVTRQSRSEQTVSLLSGLSRCRREPCSGIRRKEPNPRGRSRRWEYRHSGSLPPSK